uniref:Uncharacterized protein n=1 Tax=Oryza meridionalis TaxID=40149 RepID=A0A0E0D224_9ORYZ
MAASPWLHAVRCSTPAATPSNSRVSRRRRPTHPARLLRLTLSHSQQWWAMAAPAPKQELLPHAVKDQLPAISYCLTSPPPWLEAILYGFQHYLVMLGTTLR